jgi:voltage-gated potassium channel
MNTPGTTPDVGQEHEAKPNQRTSGRRLAELDHRRRRRVIARTIVEVVLTWAFLFGIYYLIPFTDRTTAQALARFLLGTVVFVLVFAWTLRRVTRAEFPGLRAVRALGMAIPLFLVVFAVFYLSLSQASTTHFSEPLDHSGALYLVITVFSTVGFGDITPEGDIARISVSIQMLLDLVVIGAVLRLLTTAAKTGISGAASSPPGTDASPAPSPANPG